MSTPQEECVCQAFLEQQRSPHLVTWKTLATETGITPWQCRRIIQRFDGVRYVLMIDNQIGGQIATYREDVEALDAQLEAEIRQLQALAEMTCVAVATGS
jgi:hypothetical protein